MSNTLLDSEVVQTQRPQILKTVASANKIHFETVQQEIDAICQLAKEISDGWTSPKSALEILEEMREESACR